MCAGKPVDVAFVAFGARTGAVGLSEMGFSMMSLTKLGFALGLGRRGVSPSESVSKGIVNFSPGMRSMVEVLGVDGGGNLVFVRGEGAANHVLRCKTYMYYRVALATCEPQYGRAWK